MSFITLISSAMTLSVILGCQPGQKDSADSPGNFIKTKAPVTLTVDTVVSGLSIPWGLSWLPDGRVLFTERNKVDQSINLLNVANGVVTPLCNVPSVHRRGDGGMLDLLVHPQYETRPFIYFAYSIMKPDSTSTLVVDRAKLKDQCLVERERLFEVLPYFKSNGHYGTRLQIQDNYLFISMGERYSARDSAQTLTNHFGKVMRLYDDGRIPEDNPFADTAGALAEIWSYGHRNPQGMAIHPVTGELWLHEHGPQGGDEVNIVKRGVNYGWPIITYGEEYGGGPIGEGLKEMDGMEQPIYQYTPSIAPSGMLFYTGDAFPQWKGNLFLGALALQHLNRLVLDGNMVQREERLLEQNLGRIRLVQQGPDGLIYLGVDGGAIVRLKPG